MMIQGREVRLERPEKVLYPEADVTKQDLAAYLLRASSRMLPHLKDRPLTLIRMPDGVDGPVFYQKNTPGHMPDWLPRCVVTLKGGTIEYSMVDGPAALVVLADQAVGELHGPIVRCGHLDTPDRIVFDFDPPHQDLLDTVRDGARMLTSALEGLGASVFAMRTGSRGLHLVVPLVPEASLQEVNRFADAAGRLLVRRAPDRFTMEARKAQRGRKVYVDTLRNRRNQTSVMPYSPRIRAPASVAAPVPLGVLGEEGFEPRAVTIPVAERWLKRSDPWARFFDRAVPLSALA